MACKASPTPAPTTVPLIGQDDVEQLVVVASRDDDPQGPPSQWRHLDGVYRPGQFGGEHALDILIAESLGHRDDQIRGVTSEAGGFGLVGDPGLARATRTGETG